MLSPAKIQQKFSFLRPTKSRENPHAGENKNRIIKIDVIAYARYLSTVHYQKKLKIGQLVKINPLSFLLLFTTLFLS